MRATSDVNLIAVLTAFDSARIDALREPLRLAHATVRLDVMFLLESEIAAASESFAVKFSDICACSPESGSGGSRAGSRPFPPGSRLAHLGGRQGQGGRRTRAGATPHRAGHRGREREPTGPQRCAKGRWGHPGVDALGEVPSRPWPSVQLERPGGLDAYRPVARRGGRSRIRRAAQARTGGRPGSREHGLPHGVALHGPDPFPAGHPDPANRVGRSGDRGFPDPVPSSSGQCCSDPAGSLKRAGAARRCLWPERPARVRGGALAFFQKADRSYRFRLDHFRDLLLFVLVQFIGQRQRGRVRRGRRL